MTQALLDHKLLFVTGKGGVAKSTVAAALGLLASQHGKRTLVVEVDAKGNLSDFFEAGPTGYKPREVQPNLFAMTMNTEDSLQEYLRLQMRLPAVARIGPLARAFEFVATAAPGVREILTVGKPVWEVRGGHYDLVVVDASATGHIDRLRKSIKEQVPLLFVPYLFVRTHGLRTTRQVAEALSAEISV